MFLHDLRPAEGARKDKRRIGRGHGSGRGTTAGRGNKGQKSRSGGQVNPRFEGGQLPIVLRLPTKRGFHNRNRVEYDEVNLSTLERFPAGTEINPQSLRQAGLVSGHLPIKVLGSGQVDRGFTVHAHKFSQSARDKLEAAGGKAVVIGAEAVEPEEA
ncbi:MAG: 50S ribosomal protein L15 [Chloroflexi bacterium]|nr:50S ribosomal protein L15 [Chloroflexota bacterium]MCL5109920.1 50S ribosomal protein L15 [Chloroflexota bacterium]